MNWPIFAISLPSYLNRVVSTRHAIDYREQAVTTIQEVAKRAGVSSATVSRVLNGNNKVSDANRDRVHEAVADLAYRPNRVARSLRRQQTEIIGVVVSDIENPHFTQAVRAIEDTARNFGFRVLLCNTDETPSKQQEYLDILEAERVSGVILAPADPDDAKISNLLDSNIPVVAFDRKVTDPRADTVTADNVDAVRIATEHLIQLGHVHIGFIGGLPQIQTGVDRLAGYHKAIQANGLTAYATRGDFRLGIAEAATSALLEEVPHLTALVVANNLMTVGALRALHTRNLAVPKDIALVSIDDPHWAELVDPPLTTLAQPVRQMATTAVNLLIDKMQNPSQASRQEIFNFELRIRQSCGMKFNQ
jgi:DNA-binding LacI/PurR family transcriptional regulator